MEDNKERITARHKGERPPQAPFPIHSSHPKPERRQQGHPETPAAGDVPSPSFSCVPGAGCAPPPVVTPWRCRSCCSARGALGRWSGKVLNAQLGHMKYLSCKRAGSGSGCQRRAVPFPRGCGRVGGSLVPMQGSRLGSPAQCSWDAATSLPNPHVHSFNSAPIPQVCGGERTNVAAPHAQTPLVVPHRDFSPQNPPGLELCHLSGGSASSSPLRCSPLPAGWDRAATSRAAGSQGSTLAGLHPSSPPNPSTTLSPRPSGTPSR